MQVHLIHHFRFTPHWEKLLDGVTSLRKFLSKIEKYCDVDTEHLNDQVQIDKRKNKFRGDYNIRIFDRSVDMD